MEIIFVQGRYGMQGMSGEIPVGFTPVHNSVWECEVISTGKFTKVRGIRYLMTNEEHREKYHREREEEWRAKNRADFEEFRHRVEKFLAEQNLPPVDLVCDEKTTWWDVSPLEFIARPYYRRMVDAAKESGVYEGYINFYHDFIHFEAWKGRLAPVIPVGEFRTCYDSGYDSWGNEIWGGVRGHTVDTEVTVGDRNVRIHVTASSLEYAQAWAERQIAYVRFAANFK